MNREHIVVPRYIMLSTMVTSVGTMLPAMVTNIGIVSQNPVGVNVATMERT